MSRPLPRFIETTIPTDPIEIAIAQRQAREHAAQAAIAAGAPPTDPADLRGIPCIARGVGGTSPGTNPLTSTIRTLMASSRMRVT